MAVETFLTKTNTDLIFKKNLCPSHSFISIFLVSKPVKLYLAYIGQSRVGNKSQIQLFPVIVKTNTKTRIELLNFHQVSAECMRTPKLSVIMYKLSAFTTRISLVRKHILLHNAPQFYKPIFYHRNQIKVARGSTNQNAQHQLQPRWTNGDVHVKSASSKLKGSRFS